MDDLKNLANAVLDSIVSFFEQANVDLPSRRYIAAGQTAHDCEQLTVSVQQLYLGVPGNPEQGPLRCDAPKTAVFLLELVRTVPTPGRSGKPSSEDLQITAEQQMIDLYTLLDACANVTDTWRIGVITDAAPGEPQGGYQAVTANLIMAVP